MAVRLKGISSHDGRTVEVSIKESEVGFGAKSFIDKTLSQDQLRTLMTNPIELVPPTSDMITVPTSLLIMFHPEPTNPDTNLGIDLTLGVLVPGGVYNNPGMDFFTLSPSLNTRAYLTAAMTYEDSRREFSNDDTGEPITNFGLTLWGNKDLPLVEGVLTIRVEYVQFKLT